MIWAQHTVLDEFFWGERRNNQKVKDDQYSGQLCMLNYILIN